MSDEDYTAAGWLRRLGDRLDDLVDTAEREQRGPRRPVTLADEVAETGHRAVCPVRGLDVDE